MEITKIFANNSEITQGFLVKFDESTFILTDHEDELVYWSVYQHRPMSTIYKHANFRFQIKDFKTCHLIDTYSPGVEQ